MRIRYMSIIIFAFFMPVFIYSATSPIHTSEQWLISTFKDLQQQGKLDGTVVFAKGNHQIHYFDNSVDGLDSVQGTQGQYGIGSVGKQIMSAALLKALYEKSSEDIAFVKKQLHQPIITFLTPENPVWRNGVPKWASQITTHQLLCHQSGLPDYTRFESFLKEDAAGKQFEEMPHEAWEFLALIEGAPLDFEPGTSEDYSNTGYVLIKEILQSITGMQACDYINHHLFKPLGMDHTFALEKGNWQDYRQKSLTSTLLTPLRYDPTVPSGPLYLSKRLNDAAGNGHVAFAATAFDLLKWNLALHRDFTVLPKPLYELMIAPHSKGPSGHGYGYGISRDQTRFGLALSHSAAGGARVVYIPSEEISFIVLNHITYDWEIIESLLQLRIQELMASGNLRQEAESQSISEIMDQYPPQQRGYEAVVNAFEEYLVSKDDYFISRAKQLLEWNKEKLTSRSALALEDIGELFAPEFTVIANDRKYDANHQNYFEFLQSFRSNIESLDYQVQEYIVMESTVVMPITAKVKRLSGKEDIFDTMLLVKFNDLGKIIHWQEVYSARPELGHL